MWNRLGVSPDPGKWYGVKVVILTRHREKIRIGASPAQWKKIPAVSLGVMLGLFLVLSLFSHAQAQTGWQAEWERVLAAAKKEGRLSIAGAPGDTYRKALTAGFEKSYPEIRLEYAGMSGRDSVPKIVRERQAGIYQWDIYIGGPTSALAGLKPLGAFDPLRPALIRPEVFDDGKWLGGFQEGFVDLEGKLYYAFDGTVTQPVHVNRSVIPRGEIKSAKELLDAKWAGKIVWEDPRHEGAGLNAGLDFSLVYGEDFLRRLLREQKIAYTRDRRQMAEWAVRGRYPVAVALPTDLVIIFQEKGAGQALEPLEQALVNSLIPGFGGLALMNRAPNPNAAKVYLNWLLSSDGQRDWAQTVQRNSRRLDVPPGDSARSAKAGRKYLNTQAEAMSSQRDRIMQIARELIP